MYLKVVCAWCDRFMRIKEVEDIDKPTLLITHSICPECKQKLEEEVEKFFQRIQKYKRRKEISDESNKHI
jgi:hypothetical protein